jgi:hypothetical protein
LSASHARASGSSVRRELALLQELLQPGELDVDDRAHLRALQAVEENDLVHAVQELGPEVSPHHRHHLLAHGVGVLALGLVHEILGAEIRGHDDERVAEVDRAALAVGQPPIVQDLEQDVEHVRMRLLDLVEQHDLVGPPPHRLGQAPASS